MKVLLNLINKKIKIGRVLFPATGYLYIAWNTFTRLLGYGTACTDTPVEMSDVKFVRATTMQKGTRTIFTVVMHRITGRFEITESNQLVVSGQIKHLEKFDKAPNSKNSNTESVTLPTSDFYKELKLRGYHYDGEFKSVLEATSDGSSAKIAWKDNFISFMDCMLQIGIIGYDSRSLMVPTGLEKIQIEPKIFMQSMQKSDDDEGLEFMNINTVKELNVIQTDGIRMQGLKANTIMRRKPPGEPVLESYEFVPYLLPQNLDLPNSIRVVIQLGLEILPNLKFNVVEVADRTKQNVISYVRDALDDLPMISAELTLLTSETNLELPGVTIDSESKLLDIEDCLFIFGNDLVSSKLENVSKSCKDRGFIISLESYDFGSSQICLPPNLQIISVISVGENSLVMMQCKRKQIEKKMTFLQITMNDKEFEWLEEAKQALKDGSLCLVAQGEPLNGIIGLVNCLKREPNCDAICMFIDDETAPTFDSELPFYKNQITKGLPINVYRNGVWGSYRHLLLNIRSNPEPQRGHCYVKPRVYGDLSSLGWYDGPLNIDDPNVVKVAYFPLNFRDVMVATNKIDVSFMYSRLDQECTIGFEYAGVTKEGERVMGVCGSRAMASYVMPNKLTWKIPPHWTLEEAATVPAVYATVYLALFIEVTIQRGESILIHAGTGGIGLAAIRVALHYGLDVFTTVSTEEKKQYLLDLFPKLKPSHIGNSRDTSFYEMVMLETKGVGVDHVLNSLADDKLIASVKCLAENGHFIEIGKYDILNDSKMGLGVFGKKITMHVVMLDKDIVTISKNIDVSKEKF